ncbi:hypothetical protein [Bradyrhizobium japonicum]|uniref:hypothetical protein n=1 Tax=Bradyrhizobium japonicum TaxID=375 RepID=UPI0033974CBA
MLDPTIVAISVSHLLLCDKAAAKAGVALITPASQGARMNPTIGRSRRRLCPVIVHLACTIRNLLVVAAMSDKKARSVQLLNVGFFPERNNAKAVATPATGGKACESSDANFF